MRPVALGLRFASIFAVLLATPFTEPVAARDTDSAGIEPARQIVELTKALEGRWHTHEEYAPLFLTPKGGKGVGETTFRKGPGGFTLIEEYHSTTPAGELFGSGILWWDASKGLQHLWCINVYPSGCQMFPPPPQAGPQWDGKRLFIHLESEEQGKKMVWEEAIQDITAKSFIQTVDLGEAGGHLNRWFTTHAERESGSKAP
jgi:hypothetical protein